MWIAKLKTASSVAGIIAFLAVGGLTYCSTSFGCAAEKEPVQRSTPAEGTAVAPDEVPKLLQEIIRGHQANREAMRSLHVRFQSMTDSPYSRDPKKHQDRQIEWWQEENKIRETQRWVERWDGNRGMPRTKGQSIQKLKTHLPCGKSTRLVGREEQSP